MSKTYLSYQEADTVLDECRKRGVQFALVANSLDFEVTAPEGVLDADLLKRISQSYAKIAERLRKPFRNTVCLRCGSIKYIETPVHGGQSTSRDCARCNWFMCFPVWYGKKIELPSSPFASKD